MIYSVFYTVLGWLMLLGKISLLTSLGTYAPDGMIPLIFALGLSAPRQRGLAVAFILGFVADAVTGHYLGLHTIAFGCAFLLGNFLRERFYVGSPSFLFSYFVSLSLFARLIEGALALIIADQAGLAWLYLTGIPFALLNDLVLGLILHKFILKIDNRFGWLPADEIELGPSGYPRRFGQ